MRNYRIKRIFNLIFPLALLVYASCDEASNAVTSAECALSSDCPGSEFCSNGRCMDCHSNADCPHAFYCSDNQCVQCIRSSECLAAETCSSDGRCIACRDHSECMLEQFCSTEGKCINAARRPPLCGNGILDIGERCDPAIPQDERGACPLFCIEVDPCRPQGLIGEGCEQRCGSIREISLSVDGDQCCLDGVQPKDDTDCLKTCGNGVVDRGEVCDDGIERNGSPNACAAHCNGPTPAKCGNSILEWGEICDDGANNGKPFHCDATCSRKVSAATARTTSSRP